MQSAGRRERHEGIPLGESVTITDNRTGKSIEVSRHTEATTVGAAYLAGLAVGVWSSFDDIADAWSPREVVEPSGRLDREQWASAVERSRGWIPDLSALDF